MTITNLSTLTDRQLLCEIKAAANHERTATATLIALLAEMDARRLYLGEGCSSLFTYCTQVLRLSEHAAYGRIEAARVARRFPIVLDRVASGSLTLTALTLVAPHLTVDNHVDVLTAAHHQSKREIERLVAALRPKPDASPLVRKLPRTPAPEMPTPAPAPEKRLVFTGTSPDAPSRPVVVAPLAPVRYKVQFTVSRETHDKLRRVQDLLRHSIPNGDPAAIFDRALTLLLNDLERSRTGARERPRPRAARRSTSRHIPASVRRDVWKRDGGRCTFVGAEGRCTETILSQRLVSLR
jgi:5-methylcytosine-specific restriction endonuclease McrA